MVNRKTNSLSIRVGDITYALASGDPDLKLEAQGAAGQFVVSGGNADVHIRATWSDSRELPLGDMLFDAGELWRLYRVGSDYLFHFTTPKFGPVPYKTARFSADFASGEISLYGDYFRRDEPVYPLEYPLDELLMVNLLAQGRGVEVHACGLRDADGEGYLFLGQSGAGKTTTARLWQNDPAIHILSDDRIILRRIDGKIWMYGTPWHGEAELASPMRTRLSQIFLLKHGRKNEVIPVRAAEAIARLMTCSFVPFYSPSGLDNALEFFERLVRDVPVSELHFIPDERAVELVRRMAPQYA